MKRTKQTKRNVIYIALVAAVVLAFIAFAMRTEPEEVAAMDPIRKAVLETFETYEFGHLTISHPPDWGIEPQLVSGGRGINIFDTEMRLSGERYACATILSIEDTRNMTAQDWVDEYAGIDDPDLLESLNILYHGLLELDGVDAALVTAQVFDPGGTASRMMTNVYIPHNGTLYLINTMYAILDDVEAILIGLIIESLMIADEPWPPRTAEPVEFETGEVEGDAHVLNGMTMWVPAHWDYVKREFEESEFQGESFTVELFNPETDRSVLFHTSVFVEVSVDIWGLTAHEWLESWIDSPSVFEFGIKMFDGREGAYLLSHLEDDGVLRIHEMMLIPYDGKVYSIQFHRSPDWEPELNIFYRIRNSIRFPNEEDAP